MNVRLDISSASCASLSGLRDEYLDGLPQAQDGFLEASLAHARFYRLERSGKLLGYCASSSEGILLEFHLTPSAVYLAQSVFPHLLRRLCLRAAWVKSFDHLALSCALDLSQSVMVLGMLVRRYTPQPLPILPRIVYGSRLARPSDLPRVLAVDQDVFTNTEKLRDVIQADQMYVFERENQLIGFGMLNPVVPSRPEVEVSIAIDAPYRNKGYAAFVLRDLVENCLRRSKKPIMGCAISNLASIRLGQRIGLCAEHRLLEVRFAANLAQAQAQVAPPSTRRSHPVT